MTHANAAMPDAAAARSSGSWEEFCAPGPWNAPAAYWFWHHIPTRSEIVAQIQAMRDAGYQSFQIQTRLSFPRDRYLSDDYLAMCRLAADEAASRGMMIGIYDEYNWLSGWRFRPVTQDADATCSWQPIMPFDGWQAQGYPTFCGTGEYRIDVEIPDDAVSPDRWELLLPATEDSVEVLVNGRPAGAAPWPSGAIRLGGLLHAGVNALTVRVTSSAANHYYHGTGLQGDGPARCGLLAPPVLRPVRRWHDIDSLLA